VDRTQTTCKQPYCNQVFSCRSLHRQAHVNGSLGYWCLRSHCSHQTERQIVFIKAPVEILKTEHTFFSSLETYYLQDIHRFSRKKKRKLLDLRPRFDANILRTIDDQKRQHHRCQNFLVRFVSRCLKIVKTVPVPLYNK